MSIRYKLTALDGKVIAIDGPAGSGKSTTARLLASQLGFVYLDTGAMYRAITWFALRNDLPIDDGSVLSKIAKKSKIAFEMDGDLNRVYLNSVDVTEEIRTPEVTKAVSQVSAHPGVRREMVRRQKQIGRKGNIVAEGRDTTSVVFPDADIKIYLDASLEERARRRLLELSRKGISSTLEEQVKDLKRRDKYDSNREVSPLKKTRDAIVIDTTNLTIEEQVDRIVKLIKTRLTSL
jgi:cytidylate kinase